ncbi:DapH/DapD/GlmU-related protein [uncultured Fusobacterium sp.]|uniref:acyltransferase n=1 Tax=uncultured Fusobacterium sp. TaxID=159267 RepID=UPI00258E68E3|nr:acyltransferase [uncultured Fusobacterium sp.]
MNKLKLFYIKIRMKFFPFWAKKYDFNIILKASGIKVGKGTIFYGPETMQIDRSRPYLLSIGEYCKITSNVIILTHDYSRSVLRRVYGDVVGEGRKTYIGNNVFIGMGSIILMGTHIGNNVIVGAGSVVSGTFPDNVVIAGNPARIIRTLDEHYKIKKNKMLSDAKECVNAFYEKYHIYPSINDIGAFWPLFLKREKEMLINSKVNWHLNGDEPEEILMAFIQSEPPMFESYSKFLNYCLSGKSNLDK